MLRFSLIFFFNASKWTLLRFPFTVIRNVKCENRIIVEKSQVLPKKYPRFAYPSPFLLNAKSDQPCDLFYVMFQRKIRCLWKFAL